MGWQVKSRNRTHGNTWVRASEDHVLRIFEMRFHRPKQMLAEIKSNPGLIVETMFYEIRYLDKEF